MKNKKISLIIFLIILLIFSIILNKNIFFRKKDLKINKKDFYLSATTSLNDKIRKINNINLEKAEIKIEKRKINNNFNQNSNINENLGTYGRLYLPSINLNVAVYNANLITDNNYNAQSIVDKIDSAAYFELGNKGVIADHNYQGFNKIMNIALGSSAYIKKSDGTIDNYKLNNKFIGKNISTDLIDSNGKSVSEFGGQLLIYTCYNSSNDIMITLWSKV